MMSSKSRILIWVKIEQKIWFMHSLYILENLEGLFLSEFLSSSFCQIL
jgi:hypothetical protein